MVPFRTSCLLLATILVSSCNVAKDAGPPPLGEAFAGPAKLILHTDIDPKSPAAATVPHGEKLEILQQKRRWYKVRAANGSSGWTDDRQLLDKAQMARLQSLAKEAVGLQSQGIATAFDTLNIHTEPNRFSPSFVQVKEGEKMEILSHKVMKREPPPKRQLVPPPPKKPKGSKKKKKSKIDVPELPPPAPPSLPSNWLALSRERGVPVADIADEQTPQDDWMLVRVPSGQTGWALTGRLFMAIPDDVAQYAEGHRIMSYFSLGKTTEGGQTKDIWLWTTAVRLAQDHDFDSYRVFSWSARHHRYETAFIQRRVKGYMPVLVKPDSFSVCIELADGRRVRKLYSLNGTSVRPAGEQPCKLSGEDHQEIPQQLVDANAAKPAPRSPQGWLGKAQDRIKTLFQRKKQTGI